MNEKLGGSNGSYPKAQLKNAKESTNSSKVNILKFIITIEEFNNSN